MICKILHRGDKIPRGFGLAYWDENYDQTGLYCLFPINHIIGSGRWLWYKIRDVSVSDREREMLRKVSIKKQEVEKSRYETTKHAYNVGWKDAVFSIIREVRTGRKDYYRKNTVSEIWGAVLKDENKILK